MGIISKFVKTGLLLGTAFTAYQASEKTRKTGGSFKTDAFMRNFKDQAVENSRLVVDTVKSAINGQRGDYRVSDKGENGYAYKDSESAGDKVNEVFETIREKAPEVIDKVQGFVEDVRENAPEYKAKAQDFVEDVREAAKRALDKDDKTE